MVARYEVIYQNPEGVCFLLDGTDSGYGGSPEMQETAKVENPIFGEINLDYTTVSAEEYWMRSEFHKLEDDSVMQYSFASNNFISNEFSYSPNDYDEVFSEDKGLNCSKFLGLNEPQKILSSLRYLNPSH